VAVDKTAMQLPKPSAPIPEPADPAVPVGLWAAFAQRHLFDYNASATRRWLGLALSGALALGWAGWQISALPWVVLAQVQLGIGFVVAAASAAAPKAWWAPCAAASA